MILLLQIFSWFWQWNNFENRFIFDEVKTYQKSCYFWATRYIQILWHNWPAKQPKFVKKRKIKAWLLHRSRSFKVIEVGINRKPVCDFLLVINSNWHHISYRFAVITAYCSNFGHFAFLNHPLGGGLRDNVRCSYWAHWKTHSGLPISVNWTFFARC